ncbi:MAG: benzoyl-CoA reductase subunit D [Planctomycetota bacterium]
MNITAGIDVGSSALKMLLVDHREQPARVLAKRCERLRQRDFLAAAREGFDAILQSAGVAPHDIAYIATTGEGERIDFRTGHFYGMTAHGRGGLALVPQARAVLDAGALHARAIVIDDHGKVLRYRMTSQCASGSGQFIENIARYLGVALEEIGVLSIKADRPEKCSSICAVLAETDVINMVSRGISVPNILKGIHLSMASRFVRLLESAGASGVVAVTGGLAKDAGLVAAMQEEANRSSFTLQFVAAPDGAFAGALGAALWAKYRLDKLVAMGASPGASVVPA